MMYEFPLTHDWGKLLAHEFKSGGKKRISQAERNVRRDIMKENGIMGVSEWERLKFKEGDTIVARCMNCRKEYRQEIVHRRNLSRFCMPGCMQDRTNKMKRLFKNIQDRLPEEPDYE